MNTRLKPTRAAQGLALALLAGTAAGASANVLLSYQFISPELPAGTRCLLVASTTDGTFGQPGDLAGASLTPGAAFGVDEVVLGVFTAENLPGSVTGCAGALSIDYSGNLDAGDPLQIVWLPGLGSGATQIPLGTDFVSYRSALAADGSTIGYALPADGSTESVYSLATAYGGTTVFPPSGGAVPATFPAGQNTDGDRFDDLTEFAMGLNIYQELTPEQETLELINGGANLRMEFGRLDDLAIHNLVFEVESSLTLANGSWFTVPMQPSVVAGRWEVVVPTPTGTNARQFFRFKLTSP